MMELKSCSDRQDYDSECKIIKKLISNQPRNAQDWIELSNLLIQGLYEKVAISNKVRVQKDVAIGKDVIDKAYELVQNC